MNNIELNIIEAYLVNRWSHRVIEKRILGLDSPVRGGGYVAMSILHQYGIRGSHKGMLAGKGFDRALFSKCKNISSYLEFIDSQNQAHELSSDSSPNIVLENNVNNFIELTSEEFSALIQASDMVIQMSNEQYCAELDYSTASILKLNGHLDKRFHSSSPSNIEALSELYGVYYGELVRRSLGGKWVRTHGDIYGLLNVGPNERTVLPMDILYNRLVNTKESLLYNYIALKAG